MGGAIGVSILGAILTSTVNTRIAAGDDVQHAYISGLSLLFKASCAPAGIVFLGGIFIKKVDLHIISPGAGEAAAVIAETEMPKAAPQSSTNGNGSETARVNEVAVAIKSDPELASPAPDGSPKAAIADSATPPAASDGAPNPAPNAVEV